MLVNYVLYGCRLVFPVDSERQESSVSLNGHVCYTSSVVGRTAIVSRGCAHGLRVPVRPDGAGRGSSVSDGWLIGPSVPGARCETVVSTHSIFLSLSTHSRTRIESPSHRVTIRGLSVTPVERKE